MERHPLGMRYDQIENVYLGVVQPRPGFCQPIGGAAGGVGRTEISLSLYELLA